MSEITLGIVPDETSPDGGHAIVRLTGVSALPPGATVRVEPIQDAVEADALADWPYGDWAPVAIRATSSGLDIVVGPSIVDSMPLTEGTPVIVSIPAADIRQELIWPAIARSRGTPSEPVIMSVSHFIALTALKEPPPVRSLEADAPVVVRSVASAGPPQADEGQNKRAAETSSVLPKADVGATIATAPASRPAHPAGASAPPRRSRWMPVVALLLLAVAGVGAWWALEAPKLPSDSAMPAGPVDRSTAKNEAWWAETERQRRLSEAKTQAEEDALRAARAETAAERDVTAEGGRTAPEERSGAGVSTAAPQVQVERQDDDRARAAALATARKAAEAAASRTESAGGAGDAEEYRRAALETARRIAEQARRAAVGSGR